MFIGYRPKNVAMIGEGFKVKALAVVGWVLGVQFHVQGIPFGR